MDTEKDRITTNVIEIIGTHPDDISQGDTITLDLSSINQAALDSNSMIYTGMSGTMTVGGAGPLWSINNSGTFTLDDFNINSSDLSPGATIKLKGEDADIDINGVSLMETLRGIQDRLNILRPDPEMEAEWQELKQLREQYEEKLKQCREKSTVWKALKS